MQVTMRSRASLIAENLFPRKHLAFYQERNIRPQRLTDSARITLFLGSMVGLAKRSGGRKARNVHRLASVGVSAILALEVTGRQASVTKGLACSDCRDGSGESDLG